MNTVQEVRLARLVDERSATTTLHDNVLASAEAKDDKGLTESQQEQIEGYRTRMKALDDEILELTETVEAGKRAEKEAKRVRAILASESEVLEPDGDDVAYRSFAAYARDVIITSPGKIAQRIAAQAGGVREMEAARERLNLAMRVNNTLSSNVGGLIPPQHIAQIFQVIDKSRPLVESALRAPLERGTLTYPVVTTPPVVALQASEKTQGGDTGMVIDMVTRTASTYHGGGDLSWQAINWSTPDALQLWFDLVAADYALKTETDAATILSASAFLNNISSPIGSSPTFAQFMTAVGAGVAEVFANSGRIANTIYMAPDRYGYLLGLTSDAFAQFTAVSTSGIGPLSVVVSRGFNSGEISVGDRAGLLCAETPGAPVELNVVEPAIGGVEVGLIGAFEAAVVDDGAFALITTAS